MDISQGQSLATNKKMKREESSNSSGVEVQVDAGQSQESKVKGTTVKNFPPENAIDNEESASSSRYWTRSRKEAPVPEIKEKELARKQEINEAAAADEANESEGPINYFPPEMLIKILECVNTRSLFQCRLVSRGWLEISSEILTRRTDSILKIEDYDIRRIPGFYKYKNEKNNRLQEFVKCMEKCKNVPCTRFHFNIDGPSFFDGEDWIQFLSVFAPSDPKQNQNQKTRIQYLKFEIDRLANRRKLLLFTEKLRDLLLSKIPRLEELGLEFSSSSNDSKKVKLFPLSKGTEPKTSTNINTKNNKITAAVLTSVPAPVSVQLAHLKVLKIGADMYVNFPGIVEDLLNAAVNLTRIHVERLCWIKGDSQARVFHFLHSLGKLHLVKNVELDVGGNFLSGLKKFIQDQQSNFLLGFKLQELTLTALPRDIAKNSYADAANFISNLLDSSKDTVETLEMSPLGFLSGLQFPKFTKLRTLNTHELDDDWYAELGVPLFPPGIRSISRSRDIFPLVDELNLKTEDWSSSFPQEDSIPIFPSVHTFYFYDEELAENTIAQLVLLCPNLKYFVIKTCDGNPQEFNFCQVGREIWTHLNQLESLEVDVDLNLKAHAFPALDSCFTGISMENCQRLQELMEAEKTRNENSIQVQLPESEELKKLTQREHPSILDMKSLKKLVINPHSGKKRNEGGNLLTTKITWISQEFAFKLMPHLEFNGRRPSTSS